MANFVIDMNERTFDTGKAFKLDLQCFANVMGFSKRHLGRKHNVDFNKEVVTSIVCTTSVDSGDARMSQSNVCCALKESNVSAFANNELNIF